MWEGEAAPVASADDHAAIRVHAMLSNGMGGYDWAGLPLMVEWIGVQDVEGLLARLHAIRQHMAQDDDKPTPKGTDA